MPELTLRGVRLPSLLVTLLADGRWAALDDRALRAPMPWFEDPLTALANDERMRRESGSLDLFADDEQLSEVFCVLRGSRRAQPVELPWLDVEQAVLIAVNRDAGDDVAIALDYRTDADDPRVVASDCWTDPSTCSWRTVAPTFTAFAAELGLAGDQPGD
jgi:hypothetical protein